MTANQQPRLQDVAYPMFIIRALARFIRSFANDFVINQSRFQSLQQLWQGRSSCADTAEYATLSVRGCDANT